MSEKKYNFDTNTCLLTSPLCYCLVFSTPYLWAFAEWCVCWCKMKIQENNLWFANKERRASINHAKCPLIIVIIGLWWTATRAKHERYIARLCSRTSDIHAETTLHTAEITTMYLTRILVSQIYKRRMVSHPSKKWHLQKTNYSCSTSLRCNGSNY